MAATASSNKPTNNPPGDTSGGAASTDKPTIGSILRQGLLGTVVGLLINTLLYYIGSALGGFPPDFIIETVQQPLTVISVIITTLVGALAGIVFYLGLSRFFQRETTNRIFLIIASVVLIVMAVTPLSIAGAPFAMIFFLELMHVGIGLPLMYFLIRS